MYVCMYVLSYARQSISLYSLVLLFNLAFAKAVVVVLGCCIMSFPPLPIVHSVYYVLIKFFKISENIPGNFSSVCIFSYILQH